MIIKNRLTSKNKSIKTMKYPKLRELKEAIHSLVTPAYTLSLIHI